MTAEIIEFSIRKQQHRLVSVAVGLEEILREVEGLAAEQPANGLDRLLTIMERLGDKLVESSSLLLDEDTTERVQAVFTSLSAKIAETRHALDGPGEPSSHEPAASAPCPRGIHLLVSCNAS